MVELDREIFGKITTKEIIGSDPPAIPETKEVLEKELSNLISRLDLQSKEDLQKLLAEQKNAEIHVNSRPGAMALAQDKIQLFNEYSSKYVQAIEQRLE